MRQRFLLVWLPSLLVAGLLQALAPLPSRGESVVPPLAPGTWRTTGDLAAPRAEHAAIRLDKASCRQASPPPDYPCGKVLVAGGFERPHGFTKRELATGSAELYDPVRKEWATTSSMHIGRALHLMTLLSDGRVLASGGCASGKGNRCVGLLASVEIYDPITGLWSLTGSMNDARYAHTATLVGNGVLVAGGCVGRDRCEFGQSEVGTQTAIATSELFDPADTGTDDAGNPVAGGWRPTGALATARGVHTATRLTNGKVLVTGGRLSAQRCQSGLPPQLQFVTASAEVYDPAAGTWAPAGTMGVPRASHTATLLDGGRVLVAGGTNRPGNTAQNFDCKVSVAAAENSAEVYDPVTGTFSPTGPILAPQPRNVTLDEPILEFIDHTATRLGVPGCVASSPSDVCGRVLVAGGRPISANLSVPAGITSSALYDLTTNTWLQTGFLVAPRVFHTTTILQNGLALAAGGYRGGTRGQEGEFISHEVIALSELFDPASTVQPPSVTKVEPTGGPAGGGTAVTLTGAGFTEGATVRFGSAPGVSSVVQPSPFETEDVLTVTSPASPGGAKGPVSVVVTTPAGESTAIRSSTFTYGDPPAVTSISPSSGSTSGGTTVVVRGSAFEYVTQVLFANRPAVSFRVDSPTQISAVSPAGSAGQTAAVRVRTAVGISPIVSAPSFTYIAPGLEVTSLSPDTGPIRGGTTVLLTGESFSGATTVRFGDAEASTFEVESTGTEIEAVTPPHTAGPVDVTVTTPSGVSPIGEAVFTYVEPALAVTGLEPPAGGTTESTEVTVVGEAFRDVATVHFGSLPARRFEVVSETEIRAVAPPQAQGEVPVVVTAGGQRSGLSSGSRFSYGPGMWQRSDPLTRCEVPSGSATCTARYLHTATVLDGPECQATSSPPHCGKILVAGGTSSFMSRVRDAPSVPTDEGTYGVPRASAQLYDPRTGGWSRTAPMTTARHSHTASLLPDGRVLVAGGQSGTNGALDLAEIYDPASQTWTPTGSLMDPRFAHRAEALPSGRVLVAGGTTTFIGRAPTATAELFDPETGRWSRTTSMRFARVDFSTTLLPDGSVLASGGLHPDVENDFNQKRLKALTAAEVYDPGPGTWRRVGGMAVGRFSHTATLITADPCGPSCGHVLVVGGIGGFSSSGEPIFLRTAELFDPGTGSWSPLPSLNRPHGGHTATALPDGRVLVAGGGPTFDDHDVPYAPSAGAELFDPVRGDWINTDFLGVGRGVFTATLLTGPGCRRPGRLPAYCNRVLAVGGAGAGNGDAPPPLDNVELYTAAPEVNTVSPSSGTPEGGTPVTITGKGFSAATSVRFGKIDVVPSLFHIESDSRITLLSPPHPTETVQVAVINDGGTSAHLEPATSALFTYGVPGAVDDLRGQALSETEVRLSFSAPDRGDGRGPATRYVIKQSPEALGAENFTGPATTALCGGVCEFPPARLISVDVLGLTPGTTYHYALVGIDVNGVPGPVSNDAVVTTPDRRSVRSCSAAPIPGPGQVLFPGARYSLAGVPAGTVLGADSSLYGWLDKGAGGLYSVNDPSVPAEGGVGYWAWFACPRLVTLAGAGASRVTLPLGAYHASMVGNPSGVGPAEVTGHDFAARWDPDLNGGAGGYHLSGYREPQELGLGQGLWAFSYSATTVVVTERVRP